MPDRVDPREPQRRIVVDDETWEQIQTLLHGPGEPLPPAIYKLLSTPSVLDAIGDPRDAEIAKCDQIIDALSRQMNEGLVEIERLREALERIVMWDDADSTYLTIAQEALADAKEHQ